MSELDNKADLGVLFIHGIGQQTKGETLVNWLDPIIDWTSAWIVGGRSGAEFLKRTVPLRVIDAQPRPFSDGDPANATVEINSLSASGYDSTADQADRRRLLFAEAYWANCFPAPSSREVLSWLLGVIPHAIPLHFGKRCRQLYRSKPQGLTLRIVWAGQIAISVSQVLAAAFLITPVALLALTALPILYLVPKLGEAALRSLYKVFANVLGDSMVLCASRIREAAIVNCVRSSMDWLRTRCDSMVIVAHSQGAAVLRQSISGASGSSNEPPPNLVGIVTFGSGIRKLDGLYHFASEEIEGSRSSGNQLVLRIYRWLLFSLLLLTGLRLVGLPSVSTPLVVLLFILASLNLALYAFLDVESERPTRQWWVELKTLLPRIRWLDLYATNDPVSNGQLWTTGEPPSDASSLQVTNRSSLMSDHITYWENRAGFVSRIATFLFEAAPGFTKLGLGQTESVRLIEQHALMRSYRLRLLKYLVWATIAVIAGSLVWSDHLHLRESGQILLQKISATSNFIQDSTSFPMQWIGAVVTDTLAIMYFAGAALSLLLLLGLRSVSRSWNELLSGGLTERQNVELNNEVGAAMLATVFLMSISLWWLYALRFASLNAWAGYVGLLHMAVFILWSYQSAKAFKWT